MNTNSQFNNNLPLQPPGNLPNEDVNYTNKLTGDINMMKRDGLRPAMGDRFELLSAYLDGEVTAVERKQVEDLLKNDKSVQALYHRLLKLRQGLRVMPIPDSQPVEVTVQQVLKRLRRRSRLAVALGGTAIAACALGALSGFFGGENSQMLQMAQTSDKQVQPESVQPADTTLTVALNNPVIPIPKVAQAAPEKLVIPQTRSPKSTSSDNAVN
jgi:anti-sigma factor RsiW